MCKYKKNVKRLEAKIQEMTGLSCSYTIYFSIFVSQSVLNYNKVTKQIVFQGRVLVGSNQFNTQLSKEHCEKLLNNKAAHKLSDKQLLLVVKIHLLNSLLAVIEQST